MIVSRTAWLVFGSLLPACGPHYETEQVRVTLADDLPGGLCEGDLRQLQREVDRIERVLGIRMRKKVDLVYWGGEANCKRSFDGCYSAARHRINANAVGVVHELVHAVTHACDGECDRFFDEGVAVALDGHVRFPYVASRPSENLGRKSSPSIDYDTAGHFTRWLLDEHGAAKIRALLRGEDFERVYGESLDVVEQQWLTTSPWLYPAIDSCADESLMFDERNGHDEIVVDCESDGVRSGGELGMGTCRTFEIESEGLYRFSSSHPTWIERCQLDIIEDPVPIEREAIPAVFNFNRPLKYFAPGEVHEALFREGVHRLCIQQDDHQTRFIAEFSMSSTATTVVRP